MRICSFPPIADKKCKLPILGTMPGKDSLKYNEYYAHPRNTFWKLMFDVLGTPYSNDYKSKQKLLLDNNIALWDVLATCYREGSLDSDILEEEPHDIKGFIDSHPKVSHLLFNGKSSYQFFKRYGKDIELPPILLPSTSPAYVLSYEKKREGWTIIKNLLEQ
ncbi:MAG: DNA-deoxyinosine glycosylase [Bacteroidia bacterium]